MTRGRIVRIGRIKFGVDQPSLVQPAKIADQLPTYQVKNFSNLRMGQHVWPKDLWNCLLELFWVVKFWAISFWGCPILPHDTFEIIGQPASQWFHLPRRRWGIGQWESLRTSRWQTSRRGRPGRGRFLFVPKMPKWLKAHFESSVRLS